LQSFGKEVVVAYFMTMLQSLSGASEVQIHAAADQDPSWQQPRHHIDTDTRHKRFQRSLLIYL